MSVSGNLSDIATDPSSRWAQGCGLSHTAFHGQGVEDKHVFTQYFSQRCSPPYCRNGVYVEMGAHDGLSVSNTAFFDRELNWSGLLVEPSIAFRTLERERGGKRNPRNVLLNEAVCTAEMADADGTALWSECDSGLGRTSSLVASLSLANEHRFHTNHSRGCHVLHRRRVPCRPLSAMLRAAKIDRIDFFSLDVEVRI